MKTIGRNHDGFLPWLYPSPGSYLSTSVPTFSKHKFVELTPGLLGQGSPVAAYTNKPTTRLKKPLLDGGSKNSRAICSAIAAMHTLAFESG